MESSFFTKNEKQICIIYGTLRSKKPARMLFKNLKTPGPTRAQYSSIQNEIKKINRMVMEVGIQRFVVQYATLLGAP